MRALKQSSALLLGLALSQVTIAQAQDVPTPPPEALPAQTDPAAQQAAPEEAAAADVAVTNVDPTVAEAVGAQPTETAAPLSQAELEALGFSAGDDGAVSSLDTNLHVSGFLDF